MESPTKVTVKLNARIVPALVVLLIALQLAFPFKGWTLLLVAIGGAWLVAFFWARAIAAGLRLVREMRFGWAQVGDHLEERFTLVNRSWAPALWVEVIDHSTMPGYEPGRATGVDAFGENSWTSHGLCTRRGLFTLGPATLRTGDPFGLYTVTVDVPAFANMMVMPPIVPLPQIKVALGGRAGEGRRRTNAFERTVNAATVRDYNPGDSFNSVHWPVSAHRDELSVRVFDSAPAGDWWIILDLHRHVQIGEGEDSTLEHAIILAASLADHGLRMKRAVGLVAAGGELLWLAPQPGEARRWEILRALALAAPGNHELGDLLGRVAPALRAASSLVLITPAAGGDWLKSLLTLRARGAIPTVLLLDPRSFGGDGDTEPIMARLADLEIAREVITRDLLDRPERRPGQQGQWDWQITPAGRAIPRFKPADTTWKALT